MSAREEHSFSDNHFYGRPNVPFVKPTEFYLADLFRRAIATAIDYFIFSLFYAFLLVGYGNSEVVNGRPEYYLEGPLILIPVAVWFLTFPLMESREGMTIGKRWMKLKVIRLDSQPLTLGDTLKRRILDWIDFAFVGLPSIISSTNSAARQRLGDRLAGTTVIDIRRGTISAED